MRKLVLVGLAQVLLILAGCGGSSGSVATSQSSGGGGGGGGGGQASNAVTINVDSGPVPATAYDVDTPFITLTVCAPGSTTNCQQIDHVEVDTGSYGLRIISSVLATSLASALPQETGAGSVPIVECTQFADGFSWGPVKLADVQIAGESASNVPIQVMGDPAFEGEIPTACSSTGTEEDTVAKFGANAILGVGPFADDCGSGCATVANNGWYYLCPANGTSPSSCVGAMVSEQAQVTDPVAFFQTDNNGVIVELPSVSNGAMTATGTLVFGIGTQSNNSMGAQTVLTASSSYGDVTTTYTTQGGTPQFLPFSYFDTGSNAYYFSDDNIPSSQGCSGYPGYNSSNPDSWYCPPSELSLSATNTGQNGTQSTVGFFVDNAYTLFQSSTGTVFDNLGASSGAQSTNCTSMSVAAQNHFECAFDFGFPFFLGRSVYIAFAGSNTAWGTGPYFAY
ncbi:MAG TPA: DUF3443 family protein [Steroidobacteraceae bacterium]|nr:DUF3443 family protein [Steroidobacteraceae bacterium]